LLRAPRWRLWWRGCRCESCLRAAERVWPPTRTSTFPLTFSFAGH